MKTKLANKNLTSEEMYLDYFNNWLTVQGFADHYGISLEMAVEVISKGRVDNHKRTK